MWCVEWMRGKFDGKVGRRGKGEVMGHRSHEMPRPAIHPASTSLPFLFLLSIQNRHDTICFTCINRYCHHSSGGPTQ